MVGEVVPVATVSRGIICRMGVSKSELRSSLGNSATQTGRLNRKSVAYPKSPRIVLATKDYRTVGKAKSNRLRFKQEESSRHHSVFETIAPLLRLEFGTICLHGTLDMTGAARQMNIDLRPLLHLAFDDDRATVGFDNRLADGKP